MQKLKVRPDLSNLRNKTFQGVSGPKATAELQKAKSTNICSLSVAEP